MENLIRSQERYFTRSKLIIRIFYAILLYTLMNGTNLLTLLEGEVRFIPALQFLEYLPKGWLPGVVYAAMLPVLLAFFAPQSRILRILSALAAFITIGLYSCVGLRSSSGLIYVWISFFFCFPPNWLKNKSFKSRQSTIFFVWMATAALLATYTLAGIWKFAYALVVQPLSGYAGGFSPDAMARVVADYILRSGQPSWLGNLVVQDHILGGPLYVYLIFVELTAFLTLFFPKYYRLLAFELMMFHLFSLYILHISFIHHIPLILLFLYYSPFYQEGLLTKDFITKKIQNIKSRVRG